MNSDAHAEEGPILIDDYQYNFLDHLHAFIYVASKTATTIGSSGMQFLTMKVSPTGKAIVSCLSTGSHQASPSTLSFPAYD
jgi:hypothetical protein